MPLQKLEYEIGLGDRRAQAIFVLSSPKEDWRMLWRKKGSFLIYGDIICPIESLNDLRDSCNWIGPIYALLASLVGLSSSSKNSNSKVNFKLGLLGLLKLRD